MYYSTHRYYNTLPPKLWHLQGTKETWGPVLLYAPLPPFFKDSELIKELHNTVSETDIGVYTEHKITFDRQISITVSKIIQVMLSFNENYFI